MRPALGCRCAETCVCPCQLPTCLLLSSFGLMTVLLTSMMGPPPADSRAGTSTLMVLRMYSCMAVLMMLLINQYRVRPLGTLRENHPAGGNNQHSTAEPYLSSNCHTDLLFFS